MATHDVRNPANMLTSEHPDDPFHATTAADLNFYLQGLLDKKEKQLQQAGNLGQRVLAQQMELEERIRQIQESVIDKPDDEEIDQAARSKYQELGETILGWDTENAQLSSAFGSSSKRYANSNQPSPTTTAFAELPSEIPEHKRPSGSAAGQSRRAKNAANRSFIDPEFAMDIGNNLLAEIRRLQSLLTERDKAIQDMKEERDDLEKTVEALKIALQEQERSSDKYREENWNLEVTLQELRSQLSDSQSSAVRLESEHKKLSKSLTQTRDQAELCKTESEKHQAAFNDLKLKHESDVAQARKHAAGLARDKQDLQQTVDTLKLQISRVNRRLPKYGSPLTPGTEDNIKDFITPAGTERTDDTGTDFFTGGASTNRRRFDNSLYPDGFGNEFYDHDTPEDSPIRRPFQTPNSEIEALQQRLAHAQRQINTLKGSLNREKQIRIRLENAAGVSHSAAQQGSEGEEDEEVEEDEMQLEDVAEPNIVSSARSGRSRRGGTPFKVGRGAGGLGTKHGRGRGGITLMQRLGMAANSPSTSSYNDEGEEFSTSRETSPPPPVPSIPVNIQQASPRTEEEEEENFFNSSSSSHTLQHQADGIQSNRNSVASVDGMDPVFANVLKRSSSSSSYSSPLRHSLLSRRGSTRRKGLTAGRRTRGGVPFKEARPPSVINDKPSALAAELGLSPAGEGDSTIEEGSSTSSPMKGLTGGVTSPTRNSFFDVEEGIREEEEELRAWRKEVVGEGDEDEEEVEEVEEVEMREFGCQTDPVPDVAKTLVDISVETDPPLLPLAKVWPEGLRRTTITQKDVASLRTSSSSKTISNGDDHTITRSFLARSHPEDDAYSEGEETETGADDTETEADYYDARTDMNTPSLSGRASALSTSAFTESRESFHSIMTLSDHEYPSDSESDSEESIKASSSRPSTGLERRQPQQSQRQHSRNESALSVVTRSESVASYYTTRSEEQVVSYEDAGVDARAEPEVVVKEVPVEVIREVEVVKEVPVEVIREVEVVKEVPVEVIREVEVMKEVPVEVIREVIREVEVVKEVPVEVIREIEVVKEVKVEVPVEVIKEVEVIREVVKEVVKEVPVEVIKEVRVEVIKEVEVVKEVLKEVPVEVIKEVRIEVPVPVEKDVEVVKEVVKEVLVEVPVPREVEVIREVKVEVPVEVVKEVIKEVEKHVEVTKEVPVEVIKEVRVEVPVEVKVPVEVVKEVVKIVEKPVEVIRDVVREVLVEVIREVVKEVPVEVIREVVKEVPVEVIREVVKEVPVEVIREVVKEVPVEVIREVVKEVPVEVIREVVKEVPVEVVREVVKKVPVEVIREIPAPKSEVREMEIQTDDIMEFEQSTIMSFPRKQLSSTSVQVSPISGPVFIPPPPTTAPPSSLSRSISKPGSLANGSSPTTLLRAGSQHQFQFIPSNSTTSPTSKSDTAPILLSRTSRLSASDRRTSMESGISSLNASDYPISPVPMRGNRPPPMLLNALDKSKPPMMVLPPPPKAPPPPGSMLPPPFIPDRNRPPPRPLSPPPPELIQRATTPTTFGRGGSMRQLPSTSSFRSAGQYGNQPVERRQFSNASLAYSGGERSPRSSISSSDGHGLQRGASMRSGPATSDGGQVGGLPTTPNRTPRATGGAVNGHQQQEQSSTSGTDPIIIHAITQTMIGEFLWKYTRKAIGKGHGERRHRRFFWVHPYTKTLYWSSSDPGSSNVNESSAKSAYIEGVRSVLDPNPMPPGLYQYSVVVSTPQREMKITAPTKERHDIWLNALKYLLSRPSSSANIADDSPATHQSPTDYQTDDDHVPRRRRLISSPQSVRSRSSRRGGTPGDTWNSTPKGKRSRSQLSVKGSVGKRSGTPAAEYLRWNGPESPYSPSRSFLDAEARDDDLVEDGRLDLDFELHDDEDELSDGGYEGLENVRACCDGRHTVGHSHPKKHPHHQHQQGHAHTAPLMMTLTRRSLESHHQQLDAGLTDPGRPASPAWSFRSRSGSADGHSSAPGGGSGGLLSKLRFGSKRGAKNMPVLPSVDQ